MRSRENERRREILPKIKSGKRKRQIYRQRDRENVIIEDRDRIEK